MKRKILLLMTTFLVFLLFVGCSSYKRDTSPGSLTEVSLDEGLKLAKESKEAIVMFTIDTCKDCKILKKFLGPYLEVHSVEINEVRLEREGNTEEDRKNNRKKIQEVFPTFDAVPSIYYVKDGKVVDELIEAKDEIELDQWVVKNKLDKK